jgi:two-component system OmpR family response regulator
MNAGTPLIFVVDDDRSIRGALCDYLAQWSFAVRPAASGAELDALLAREQPDGIILDIMMGGEDGLAICRRLNGRFPILMLSALGDTADRVLGLEVGADDYLPKPFDPRELVARLKAIMRRHSANPPGNERKLLRFAGWTLDEAAQLVLSPGGDSLPLTGGEFSLLLAFASRPQRVLSRDMLLQLSQGPLSDSNDRAIDLTVSRLRRKLGNEGGGELIQTVWGEGYRFDATVERVRSR